MWSQWRPLPGPLVGPPASRPLYAAMCHVLRLTQLRPARFHYGLTVSMNFNTRVPSSLLQSLWIALCLSKTQPVYASVIKRKIAASLVTIYCRL